MSDLTIGLKDLSGIGAEYSDAFLINGGKIYGKWSKGKNWFMFDSSFGDHNVENGSVRWQIDGNFSHVWFRPGEYIIQRQTFF